MAATATILKLVSVEYLTNAWVDWSDFFWFIRGDWRKVPLDDQLCRLSKMAAKAAILDMVSFVYLTNASVDWSDFFVAYWGRLEKCFF
jgi:hypothetical protein